MSSAANAVLAAMTRRKQTVNYLIDFTNIHTSICRGVMRMLDHAVVKIMHGRLFFQACSDRLSNTKGSICKEQLDELKMFEADEATLQNDPHAYAKKLMQGEYRPDSPMFHFPCNVCGEVPYSKRAIEILTKVTGDCIKGEIARATQGGFLAAPGDDHAAFNVPGAAVNHPPVRRRANQRQAAVDEQQARVEKVPCQLSSPRLSPAPSPLRSPRHTIDLTGDFSADDDDIFWLQQHQPEDYSPQHSPLIFK